MKIVAADLSNELHRHGFLDVLDSYAADVMGGGQALSPEVLARLPSMLAKHPGALVLLALAGDHDERPVGVAVCFFGLSTFRAKPLLNVHDLAVLPEYRGRGIGRALLQAAEDRARQKGCCKLTLEVREDNTRARALYRSFGFGDSSIGEAVPMRFLAKPLEA